MRLSYTHIVYYNQSFVNGRSPCYFFKRCFSGRMRKAFQRKNPRSNNKSVENYYDNDLLSGVTSGNISGCPAELERVSARRTIDMQEIAGHI